MTAQEQGSDLAALFNYNDSTNVKTGLGKVPRLVTVFYLEVSVRLVVLLRWRAGAGV